MREALPFTAFCYAEAPGDKYGLWHIRKADNKNAAVALCGAAVMGARPELLDREHLVRSCRTCVDCFARRPGVEKIQRVRRDDSPADKLKEAFDLQVLAMGLPPGVKEHVFAPPRGWRLDRAWPDVKVGVEIQGGVFAGMHHTTGAGYEDDSVKAACAQLHGWLLFNATDHLLKGGYAARWVRAAVSLRSSGQPVPGPDSDLFPKPGVLRPKRVRAG